LDSITASSDLDKIEKSLHIVANLVAPLGEFALDNKVVHILFRCMESLAFPTEIHHHCVRVLSNLFNAPASTPTSIFLSFSEEI